MAVGKCSQDQKNLIQRGVDKLGTVAKAAFLSFYKFVLNLIIAHVTSQNATIKAALALKDIFNTTFIKFGAAAAEATLKNITTPFKQPQLDLGSKKDCPDHKAAFESIDQGAKPTAAKSRELQNKSREADAAIEKEEKAVETNERGIPHFVFLRDEVT